MCPREEEHACDQHKRNPNCRQEGQRQHRERFGECRITKEVANSIESDAENIEQTDRVPCEQAKASRGRMYGQAQLPDDDCRESDEDITAACRYGKFCRAGPGPVEDEEGDASSDADKVERSKEAQADPPPPTPDGRR